MSENTGYNITKDPDLEKSRIFLGNLPSCTREELVSICQPYGTVLGSMVQKHFGFVQFESEEIANKAAAALHKSTFKAKVLTVRNARHKTKPQAPQKAPLSTLSMAGDILPAAFCDPLVNDCEIIVAKHENTKYAEYIEERLRNIGLRVDVLFPNEEVMLSKVLANIASRGCLYAVLVTPQHEALTSITVNILYGIPAEHRNMPVEDAITLIATDFRLKKQRDVVMNNAQATRHRAAQRHPDKVQQLLERLADNLPLTALQYECVIKYLQGEREEQMRREIGETHSLDQPKASDPNSEQQKIIHSIMNKPAVTDINSGLMYATFGAAKEDKRIMELLSDRRVLAALETIYSSDVMDVVAGLL
ncbi:hypothetical protein KR018_008995 [Drosophila ironensis]|nr:hypothetical protein KR018_008995 [Drosophila ironensis]